MADVTRLLNGLVRYESELVRHNAKVKEEFARLQKALGRLGAHYEGVAARDFKAHFARTQRGLNEYVTGSESIRRVLLERIEHIRAADRPEIL